MSVKQQNATSPSVPQQMAAQNGTLIVFYILITLFRQCICGGPIKIYSFPLILLQSAVVRYKFGVAPKGPYDPRLATEWYTPLEKFKQTRSF